MGIKDILAALTQPLSQVADRRQRIASEIAKLEKERIELVSKPIPFDDFKEMLLGQVDRHAERGLEGIAQTLNGKDNYAVATYRDGLGPDYAEQSASEQVYGPREMRFMNLLHFTSASTHLTVSPMSEDALCAYFAPQVKAALTRALDAHMRDKWPADSEAGLPRAKRLARLREIQARIEQLRDEDAEITAALQRVSSNAASGANG